MNLATPNPESRFSSSESAKKLKALVGDIAGGSDFPNRWRAFITQFETWEASSAATNLSRLNLQLKFLRDLCAAFPDAKLNKRTEVAALVLLDSGIKNIGDTFNGSQLNGRTGLLKVISREITDRYGILYVFETQDGSRFSREFFD